MADQLGIVLEPVGSDLVLLGLARFGHCLDFND